MSDAQKAWKESPLYCTQCVVCYKLSSYSNKRYFIAGFKAGQKSKTFMDNTGNLIDAADFADKAVEKEHSRLHTQTKKELKKETDNLINALDDRVFQRCSHHQARMDRVYPFLRELQRKIDLMLARVFK